MAKRKHPASVGEVAAAEAAAPKYKFAVNEARGEARLMIDDVELVLAAEMGRLAALSSRLQCKSMADLFARLTNVEASAAVVGIELLAVEGDWLKALQKLKLKHFKAVSQAFTDILAHHFEGEAGNA